MERKTVISLVYGRVVLMDSISYLTPDEAGACVVSGSHGGLSSARYALTVTLAGVVFNDAGKGKDDAGITGLYLLDTVHMPAIAVAHTSARIGDAADTWDHGIVSTINQAAAARGVRIAMSVQDAVMHLLRPPV